MSSQQMRLRPESGLFTIHRKQNRYIQTLSVFQFRTIIADRSDYPKYRFVCKGGRGGGKGDGRNILLLYDVVPGGSIQCICSSLAYSSLTNVCISCSLLVL